MIKIENKGNKGKHVVMIKDIVASDIKYIKDEKGNIIQIILNAINQK